MTAVQTINSICIIAYRDVLKLLKDRPRIIGSLLFPAIFIGIIGTGFQASLGQIIGFNYQLFVFTGVIGQNLFQSAAAGIISLIEDRQNDFSQEVFVSPVPRTAIIFGKILGESLVAFIQVIGIFLIGLLIGVPFTLSQILVGLPAMILICLFGASFGVLIIGSFTSERAANQIFQFILFPQIFLAGIFNTVKDQPLILDILTRISPMTYAVDLIRNVMYSGSNEISVVRNTLWVDLSVVIALFIIFLILGTSLFVRNERNK